MSVMDENLTGWNYCRGR